MRETCTARRTENTSITHAGGSFCGCSATQRLDQVAAESGVYGPGIFSGQSEEFNHDIYERMLMCLAEVELIPFVDDGMSYRTSKTLELWNELRQMFQLQEQLVPEDGGDQAFLDDLSTNRLNPLRIVRVPAGEPTRSPNTGPLMGVQGGEPHFSRTGSEGVLFEIIQRSLDLNNYGGRETVRILVGGGDGTLHYLLAGYVNLFYFGELFALGVMDQLDLRFFLLPTGQNNSLATYVAQFDLWYDVSVHRVFSCRLPLVPHAGKPPSDEQQADLGGRGIAPAGPHGLGPSVVVTRQVENYLLEATHVLEVCVFNCEGWYHDGDVEVYCTIPFFSRAEIGLTVAMVAAFGERQLGQEVHRPRPSRPTGETLAGLAQRISLRLAISGVAVGLDGAETEEQTPAGSYLSVLAINVPRPHEHRLCCDPRSPTLDVCVVDDNEINRENTASLEDIVFRCRPRRWGSVAVEAVRVVSEDGESGTTQLFDVLLDGEVYGPFHRVNFFPCRHPVIPDRCMKLPVATYWPTEHSRG